MFTQRSLLLIIAFLGIMGFSTSARAATVSNTNDSGPGSLREAIANAAPGETIIFSVSGTITLTTGQLVIDKNLTIQGPGQTRLSISGNRVSRVFGINAGVTATLAGLTIRDGKVTGSNGGGILNAGTLTVDKSTVTGNASPDRFGAGIYNSGTLTVSNTTISRNFVAAQSIYDIALTGGGIYNTGSTSVSKSTISENVASVGGGIYNRGTTSVINSTISGNYALYDTGGWGAGILNQEGALTVSSSTISGNFNWSSLGEVIGGGIYINGGGVTLNNTIIAGNILGDIIGTVASASHSLIGDATWSGGIQNGVNGNIVGFDPMLTELDYYGGPTQTHALQTDSPAIDAGNAFGLTADQRGVKRPFDSPRIPNAPGGDGSDIGAFEVSPLRIRLTTPGGPGGFAVWPLRR